MEQYIKLAAQILFALATFVFVLYSIAGIYALNHYGNSKSLALSITVIYTAIVIALLGWGLVVVGAL
jgi:hypothetical protein